MANLDDARKRVDAFGAAQTDWIGWLGFPVERDNGEIEIDLDGDFTAKQLRALADALDPPKEGP